MFMKRMTVLALAILMTFFLIVPCYAGPTDPEQPPPRDPPKIADQQPIVS
jgi:hypothetical protein